MNADKVKNFTHHGWTIAVFHRRLSAFIGGQFTFWFWRVPARRCHPRRWRRVVHPRRCLGQHGPSDSSVVVCNCHPRNWCGRLDCIPQLVSIRDVRCRCFDQLVELSHFLSGGVVWHTVDNFGTLSKCFHDFVMMRYGRVRDCFVLELNCVTEALVFGGLNVTSVCPIMFR